jgi:folylpolyglutamate synthase/dihydropteroate synthase
VRAARAATCEIASTPAEAWGAVHRLAKPEDLVCITGSFFLAAEMRRQIAARPLHLS